MSMRPPHGLQRALPTCGICRTSVAFLVSIAALLAACSSAGPDARGAEPSSQSVDAAPGVGAHSGHGGDGPSSNSPASGECAGEAVSCEASNSSGAVFREVFNGDPGHPVPVMNDLDRWYAQPTVQGPTGWTLEPEPMEAQHGSDCGPPPGTHEITSFDQTVYLCRDHLMTAVNPPSTGTSSAVVSLKPNHLVDLSSGEATIRVDVSTLSPSKGDWWEIWITPWEDQLIAPTDHWFHQAGPPRRALFLQVVDLDDKKFWSHTFFDEYEVSGGREEFWTAPDIRPIVSESDTRRDTYEIRLTEDRVELLVESSETGELVTVDEFDLPRGGFWTDDAVVQFQQSNYEPESHGKHGCSDPCPSVTKPATWHWDNVEISPAIPYELIGTSQYLIWAGTPSPRIDFDEPAPEDADLMFTAMSWGNAPEVSYDDGVTWTTARAVRPPNDPPVAGFGGDPDLLTYRIAVPEGTRSADVRGEGGCADCPPETSWAAMNFHLVARSTT